MPDSIPLEERFQRINDALLEARHGGPLNRLWLAAELHALESEYTDALRSAQDHAHKIRELEERIQKLTEPPLLHAIVIGPSPRREGTFVVSVGGQRLDVSVAPPAEAEVDLTQLIAGQEVLLTRESHVVVGIVGPARRGESTPVLDVLQEHETDSPDRLLVRWGGGQGMVVEMAKSLLDLPEEAEPPSETRPKPGDAVLVDAAAKLAFEKLPSHETSELELEKDPSDRYEDIGGLDDKIDLIKEAIELPYLYRDRLQDYGLQRPRGILLYGPPGCGKTMIGRAVANGLSERIAEQLESLLEQVEICEALSGRDPNEAELAVLRRACPDAAEVGLERAERLAILSESLLREAPEDIALDLNNLEMTRRRLERMRQDVSSYFLNVKGPELLSKWVGEAEHRIRQIFVEAKRKASYTRPVVVFFDEIESMFQRRGTGISSDLEKTMVPQLLTEIDGIESLEDVVLIGASNRADLLDPALMRPGRLDMKIKIDRPDRAAAAAIFQKYLTPDLPLSAEGLTEPSLEHFERQVAQVITELCDAGAYLNVSTDGQDLAPIPLRKALPHDLHREVGQQLGQSGLREPGQQLDSRRIGLKDVAQAIESVCGAHRDRLTIENSLPEDIGRLQVALALDAAEDTVNEMRLPSLPLLPPGTSSELADEVQLAEALLDLAVDILFSPHSYLRVRILASCGREHTFLLREFISGALISDIVARAKRLALRREAQGPEHGPIGIRADDLVMAIRTEYEENKDQLIVNKPAIGETVCETCQRRHNSADEYDIEVSLGVSARDRWHLPRKRPYEQGRDWRTAAHSRRE